jgi:hypothetical protein
MKDTLLNAILVVVICVVIVVAGWFGLLFAAARRTAKQILVVTKKEDEIRQSFDQAKQKIDEDTAQKIREVYSAPKDNVIDLFRSRMLPRGPNKPN